jgi:hypothetical protein
MWWCNFRRSGELTAVAIVEAPTIYHARMRLAARGIGNPADFGEGEQLDSERAALVPRDLIGKLLLPEEAQKLRLIAPSHVESMPQGARAARRKR